VIPVTATIGERSLLAGGIEFGVLEAGAASGPLALCLHGFPDTAWTWRHLLGPLADAGYHAVAPFLRGYHPTAVPPDGHYQTGALVADAVALHEVLGGDERAVLIGHDWGAFAAYGAAAFAPDRWARVVGSAVPPLAALARGFLSFDQLKRSWYIFFFQGPLAEAAVAMDDYAFIGRLWADWSPGYDAGFDVDRVREALATAENLSAAIGYYRAMFDPNRQSPDLSAEQAATTAPVPQPALYVHGTDDGCMGAEMIEPAEVLGFLGPGSKVAIIERAGHFSHLERPAEVNGRILEFLAG
jgi:pimeloyl-ACP methyl ester carboxylesterase